MSDPTAMTFNAWIAGVSSIIAAALSSLLTHLWLKRRERAVVRVAVEDFKRIRLPLRIPDQVYDSMRWQGDFKQWAKDIVKWDIEDAFDRNAFELHELRDLRSLCPKFIEKWKDKVADVTEMLGHLQGQVDPASPTESQQRVLSRLRHFWLETFKQDIFMSFTKNTDETVAEIRRNFDGDIVQYNRAIAAVSEMKTWLDQGLGAQGNQAQRITPVPKSPDNPQEPFVSIELLVRNSGRSETLIKDVARPHAKRVRRNVRQINVC